MPTCCRSSGRLRKRWIRGMTFFALAMIAMVATCGCVAVQLKSNNKSPESAESNPNLIHFELRPTASLIEERRRQRKRYRRLASENNNTNISCAMEDDTPNDLPRNWFHPQSSAVYATLHHPLDESDDDNDEQASLATEHFRDFVKYRHLSRFERHFREQMGLNLHPHWSGNYSNATESFLELHDPFVLRKEILERSRTKLSNSNRTIDMHSQRTLLESLVGGKFDRYQGVPLSQGYGTHYVHLWVGSPIPQRQSVIVDTGSHFTGFPVARECSNCGENHHTDPHFDPERSETFRALICPSECLETFECEFEVAQKRKNVSLSYFQRHRNMPRCSFSQAYTEGSSWTAYQASDLVYCGGGADMIEAVDPLDIQYSLRFVFGCLKTNTGLFVTQLADGIMGMSAHELTLPKQLYNTRKIEYNMFAMCFRKELGTSKKGVTAGSMTLGGVSSALDTSPMVYARNIRNYGWYTVYVEKIFLATKGGTKFLFDDKDKPLASILEENNIVPLLGLDPSKVNRDRGVIVDSGTTDTYLCSSVRKEFSKAWKEATGMEYSNSAIYLTQAQLQKLPTLLVQLQASGTTSDTTPNSTDGSHENNKPVLGEVGYLDRDHPSDVLLSIPATSYMEYSPTLKVYTSRLFFTESRGGVIGANAMQGHNVLFDWHHGRIGFAQSSCSYDLIAGKNDNHGDWSSASSSEDVCVFLDDGRLPILTQTCLQSVSNNPTSMTICKASESPTNIEVEGMEIWTLRVETSGSDPSSCEDSIREWSDSKDTKNQIESSTTECTPDGLCHEYRPCHVPCLAAIEYHQKRNKGNDTSSLDEAVTIPHPFVNRTATGTDLTSLCSDWMWTGCDHSCHQSRISSSAMVTHTTGSYCIESERESRSCHIDSCGRSDPCIVPFLVHAIFVLEKSQEESDTENENPAEPPSYWTPQVEEDFRKSLVSAAHHPHVYKSKTQIRLFGEGDIDILVAHPWYGDQEEIANESNKVKDISSHQMKETSDEKVSQGIQLILQISISNPKAIPKQHKTTGGGRSLLQEVGVVWSNFTSVFRGSKATSVCNPFDLYPLAKTSNLVADEILANPAFLSLLVDDNDDSSSESNDEIYSIFQTPRGKGLKGFHSARLVSSWTIGTQIYDDSVNYLGPLASTSLYPLIKALHSAFYFISFLWFCRLVMFLSKSTSLCRVCRIRLRKKWLRRQYDVIDNDKDSFGVPRPSTGGVSASSEVEMAATYRGSKATKRANSTTTASSDTFSSQR